MRLLDRAGAKAPTVFHVTHYKAGSQWIHRILRRTAGRRIVTPEPGMGQFLSEPIREGKVYPTVYVTRQQFESAHLPERWRRFVIIRDLRDSLISAYFSVKVSHPPFAVEPMVKLREHLRAMTLEEGLSHMMDRWLPGSARIQESWLECDEPVIRYEDLLEDDIEILERTFITQCEMPISRRKLRRAVEGARFDKVTGGRRRGSEDVSAHQRKAMPGDWRNHFSESLKKEFQQRWGHLLVAGGYEDGPDW